jgi:mono/diheme cytochrome c family protein
MLYYRPSPSPVSGAPSDRGQYLVDGLGHCAMCHSTRGARDSLPPEGYLAGGLIPGSGWYAPPLDGNALSRYSVAELADYLRTGTSPRGAAYGPMADVIFRSLSALTSEDATAMAEYLKRLPPHMPRASADDNARIARTDDESLDNGAELYKNACADCHGDNGEGKDEHYPPLNDAVAVTAPNPINAVRIVLYGAMAPTTPGNPRPYSMPPFAQQLSNAEIAAVVNYIRRDSNPSSSLSAPDIAAMQGIVLE